MRIFVATLLLIGGMAEGRAQTNQQDKNNRPTGLFEGLLQQDSRASISSLPQPFEEVVDESEYIVGPQDVFQFLVPGILTAPVSVVVTAEGKLVIPNAGEFHAAGKSLVRLKEEVSRAFQAVKPSLTLLSPRTFVVTVLGVVEKPGTYMANSVLRVDKAVGLAKGTATGHSTRSIILRRKGSQDRLVDLDRFYAFRENSDNPFLREGDLIIIPPLALDQSAVSIFGAVNAPRAYEYRKGDSLGTLIRIAQGLTPSADLSNVELTRFSTDGTSQSTVIDATNIVAGTVPDIALNNKDRVVVREIPDTRRDFKVQVRGEVRFPGMYPITRDSTRLSEIIERAGGFTEFASLRLAELERRQLTAQGLGADLGQESRQNLRMTDQLVTPEERQYYELESVLRRGVMAVDFEGLFARGEKSKDVFLSDGDVVFIPNARKSVYVYGQVSRPGYVPFKEGADVRYYLDHAGGYGEEAETGGTRVIKGTTREWLDPSDTVIEAGDYIWVPKDIRYPTGYYLNLVSQAASFISVVLSMTVIILQLTK